MPFVGTRCARQKSGRIQCVPTGDVLIQSPYGDGGSPPPLPFTNHCQYTNVTQIIMNLEFVFNEEPIILQAEAKGSGWIIRLPDGTKHEISASRSSEDVLTVKTEAHHFQVATAKINGAVHLSYEGRSYAFTPGSLRAASATKRSSGSLTAPMPGVVADILVTEGQTVEAYQPLAVVEAMKVMATLEAPFAGTVSKVHVQKGRQVTQGEVLVEVTPLANEAVSL
jgi:biotin carboxyl carrier protein